MRDLPVFWRDFTRGTRAQVRAKRERAEFVAAIEFAAGPSLGVCDGECDWCQAVATGGSDSDFYANDAGHDVFDTMDHAPLRVPLAEALR